MLALLQESSLNNYFQVPLYIHTLGDWIHTHFTCQDLVWPEKNESTCRELWENVATPSEVCLVWDDSQWVSNSCGDGWSKGQTTFSVLNNPQGFKWQSVVANPPTMPLFFSLSSSKDWQICLSMCHHLEVSCCKPPFVFLTGVKAFCPGWVYKCACYCHNHLEVLLP